MIGRRGFLKAIGAVLLAPYVVPSLPVFKDYGTIELISPIQTIDVTQVFGVDFAWTDIEVALALEDERADLPLLYYDSRPRLDYLSRIGAL